MYQPRVLPLIPVRTPYLDTTHTIRLCARVRCTVTQHSTIRALLLFYILAQAHSAHRAAHRQRCVCEHLNGTHAQSKLKCMRQTDSQCPAVQRGASGSVEQAPRVRVGCGVLYVADTLLTHYLSEHRKMQDHALSSWRDPRPIGIAGRSAGLALESSRVFPLLRLYILSVHRFYSLVFGRALRKNASEGSGSQKLQTLTVLSSK